MAPSVTDNPSGGRSEEDRDVLDTNGTQQHLMTMGTTTTTFGGFSSDEEDYDVDNDEEEEAAAEDEETFESHGYVLLPQEPPPSNTDVDDHQPVTNDTLSLECTLEEDVGEEVASTAVEQLHASISSSIVTHELHSIPMDQERIDKIKAAMVGFTLPSSSIPPWASVVPEDRWKEFLLNDKSQDSRRATQDQT